MGLGDGTRPAEEVQGEDPTREKLNWQAGNEGKVWMWQGAGKRRVTPAPTIKARGQLAVRAAGRRPNNKAASECCKVSWSRYST